MKTSYTIEEHKHRLAAWSASTAASASPVCRFKVVKGFEILEASGFDAAFKLPKMSTPQMVDSKHKIWREKVIKASQKLDLEFTHGIAAKLINSYLKARFVCGGAKEKDTKLLHPPIDSLLLESLKRSNAGNMQKEWRKYANARWSKFDSEMYESVILSMRILMKKEPLWKIEEHWVGYHK